MNPKVSEEHVAARRDQIIQAACACFSRKGFHETTIADICAESGLSTGAVYGHFENKRAIIRAAAERALERLEAMLEVAREEPDPRRGLARLYDALTTCTTEPDARNMESIRLEIGLWAAAIRSPDLREILRDWYGVIVPQIAELVRRIGEVDEGLRGSEPERVARAVVAAIQGSMLQRAMDERVDLDLAPAVLAWITQPEPG